MDKPIDRNKFLEPIKGQEAYQYPLEEGMYLGFFIPGDKVVLSRIESLLKGAAPQPVACSVSRLFQ